MDEISEDTQKNEKVTCVYRLEGFLIIYKWYSSQK
jgi:hypothetical protein